MVACSTYVKWGEQWRMPTRAEYQELIDKCTWNWEYVNGIQGFRVTGPNGNSIFLPATGFHNWLFTDGGYEGTYGCFWTSTIKENVEDGSEAYYYTFRSGDHTTGLRGAKRYDGFAVRPVWP